MQKQVQDILKRIQINSRKAKQLEAPPSTPGPPPSPPRPETVPSGKSSSSSAQNNTGPASRESRAVTEARARAIQQASKQARDSEDSSNDQNICWDYEEKQKQKTLKGLLESLTGACDQAEEAMGQPTTVASAATAAPAQKAQKAPKATKAQRKPQRRMSEGEDSEYVIPEPTFKKTQKKVIAKRMAEQRPAPPAPSISSVTKTITKKVQIENQKRTKQVPNRAAGRAFVVEAQEPQEPLKTPLPPREPKEIENPEEEESFAEAIEPSPGVEEPFSEEESPAQPPKELSKTEANRLRMQARVAQARNRSSSKSSVAESSTTINQTQGTDYGSENACQSEGSVGPNRGGPGDPCDPDNSSGFAATEASRIINLIKSVQKRKDEASKPFHGQKGQAHDSGSVKSRATESKREWRDGAWRRVDGQSKRSFSKIDGGDSSSDRHREKTNHLEEGLPPRKEGKSKHSIYPQPQGNPGHQGHLQQVPPPFQGAQMQQQSQLIYPYQNTQMVQNVQPVYIASAIQQYQHIQPIQYAMPSQCMQWPQQAPLQQPQHVQSALPPQPPMPAGMGGNLMNWFKPATRPDLNKVAQDLRNECQSSESAPPKKVYQISGFERTPRDSAPLTESISKSEIEPFNPEEEETARFQEAPSSEPFYVGGSDEDESLKSPPQAHQKKTTIGEAFATQASKTAPPPPATPSTPVTRAIPAPKAPAAPANPDKNRDSYDASSKESSSSSSKLNPITQMIHKKILERKKQKAGQGAISRRPPEAKLAQAMMRDQLHTVTKELVQKARSISGYEARASLFGSRPRGDQPPAQVESRFSSASDQRNHSLDVPSRLPMAQRQELSRKHRQERLREVGHPIKEAAEESDDSVEIVEVTPSKAKASLQPPDPPRPDGQNKVTPGVGSKPLPKGQGSEAKPVLPANLSRNPLEDAEMEDLDLIVDNRLSTVPSAAPAAQEEKLPSNQSPPPSAPEPSSTAQSLHQSSRGSAPIEEPKPLSTQGSRGSKVDRSLPESSSLLDRHSAPHQSQEDKQDQQATQDPNEGEPSGGLPLEGSEEQPPLEQSTDNSESKPLPEATEPISIELPPESSYQMIRKSMSESAAEPSQEVSDDEETESPLETPEPLFGLSESALLYLKTFIDQSQESERPYPITFELRNIMMQDEISIEEIESQQQVHLRDLIHFVIELGEDQEEQPGFVRDLSGSLGRSTGGENEPRTIIASNPCWLEASQARVDQDYYNWFENSKRKNPLSEGKPLELDGPLRASKRIVLSPKSKDDVFRTRVVTAEEMENDMLPPSVKQANKVKEVMQKIRERSQKTMDPDKFYAAEGQKSLTNGKADEVCTVSPRTGIHHSDKLSYMHFNIPCAKQASLGQIVTYLAKFLSKGENLYLNMLSPHKLPLSVCDHNAIQESVVAVIKFLIPKCMGEENTFVPELTLNSSHDEHPDIIEAFQDKRCLANIDSIVQASQASTTLGTSQKFVFTPNFLQIADDLEEATSISQLILILFFRFSLVKVKVLRPSLSKLIGVQAKEGRCYFAENVNLAGQVERLSRSLDNTIVKIKCSKKKNACPFEVSIRQTLAPKTELQNGIRARRFQLESFNHVHSHSLEW